MSYILLDSYPLGLVSSPARSADAIAVTSNVSHIFRFVPADLWNNIKP